MWQVSGLQSEQSSSSKHIDRSLREINPKIIGTTLIAEAAEAAAEAAEAAAAAATSVPISVQNVLASNIITNEDGIEESDVDVAEAVQAGNAATTMMTNQTATNGNTTEYLSAYHKGRRTSRDPAQSSQYTRRSNMPHTKGLIYVTYQSMLRIK